MNKAVSMMNQNELCHYGVVGMKWGHRRARSRAKRDAKKYARAKMFYGEGAGNRRKLLNAKISERSKNPIYKKAFDDAMNKQNMERHATNAKIERKVRDTVKHVPTIAVSGLVAYGAYKDPRVRDVINQFSRIPYSLIRR